MGLGTSTCAGRARLAGITLLLGTLALLLVSARPAMAQPGCTTVMGEATTTPAQLAGWFATSKREPRLDVSVLDLAALFVEEGAREGVRGDIAFAQAIVETGYFGFSAAVPPELHNYSGLGATGGGVRGAAFPDARTGVRAQVQHLRAYADPSLRSAADLKAPLVDPRFRFLVPNPRTVPCWEQFGGGVWAADPTGYGPRVLAVHQRIAAFPRPAAPTPAPLPAPVPEVAVAPAVTQVPEVVIGTGEPAPTSAGDLWAQPGLPLDPSVDGMQTATAELSAQPAGSSTALGGGVAGALACLFTGMGLLTICVTLWWHGRRFARAV